MYLDKIWLETLERLDALEARVGRIELKESISPDPESDPEPEPESEQVK